MQIRKGIEDIEDIGCKFPIVVFLSLSSMLFGAPISAGGAFKNGHVSLLWGLGSRNWQPHSDLPIFRSQLEKEERKVFTHIMSCEIETLPDSGYQEQRLPLTAE